ncbi:MAG TPA: hypothetical protein VGJ87_14015 [Roseiflexaceae bacterium]|jgi:hypothetical protein
MRRSHTAVVERNVTWTGTFATEPYEAGWASEAIFFVRTLESAGLTTPPHARVELSPDGARWCNEGTTIELAPAPELSFVRLSHFGGWVRLAGELSPGVALKVIVYLTLKE